jgi:hypothetical protein
MCLNFFYPLIKSKKLELVLDYLGLKGESANYATAIFEKNGLERKYGETPTSFDFYFESQQGKKFYFEIKYTECDFGKVEKNKSHIDKFQKVYSKHLTPIQNSFHSVDEFLENYQILRNLVHIDDESYVIFLYSIGNKKIKAAAESVPEQMLESRYRDKFFPITWEDFFDEIYKTPLSADVQEQLSEFKNKYL